LTSETRATRGGGILPGTHFTCFTSTKLHILTAEGLRERREAVGPGGVPLRRLREEERGERGTQITGFTSTILPILTPWGAAACAKKGAACAVLSFTCFTGTKSTNTDANAHLEEQGACSCALASVFVLFVPVKPVK
jgi:hypothetical protein